MTAPREVTPEAETFLPYRERLAQRVLADLIESGHIIGVTEGGATIVSVEVHPRLLEMLFLFDADVEDMEEGHDAEQINEDGFPGMGVVGCVLEPTEDDEDEGVAVDMSSDGYGRNYVPHPVRSGGLHRSRLRLLCPRRAGALIHHHHGRASLRRPVQPAAAQLRPW